MCFEGKTDALARKLKSTILDTIDSVDQAREMIAENMKLGGYHSSQIAHMAELFYENPAQFGIERKLKQVQGHPDTKRSALRGAITQVLQQYITEYDLQQLAELGTVDLAGRRRVQAVNA